MKHLTSHMALDLVVKSDVQNVLDIGSGTGEHAQIMRQAGKRVTTVSLAEGADHKCDYNSINFGQGKFDCIWASHVLEHQPNPRLFLQKCFYELADNGVMAVTVPPLKHNIVGGHVTLWNAGLLLYNLILAGFDCRKAKVKQYGYNISVVVRKKAAQLPDLEWDTGDIERLAEFFPMPVKQGFNGDIADINWGDNDRI
jgi:SAM-dependent methyltransferase